ncbi:hypothetical protein BDN71DRAFT_1454260 [Pleurotus eryngii]|uniref:Uncharacterized protein n=1 Tax=Pleurotus eryngii TaxID=5323 RepID=A0A9P5ZNR6_PLEER|nr:hypothetical protein BDN71DRAFT_1454260 [Pleurotus eryngii]
MPVARNGNGQRRNGAGALTHETRARLSIYVAEHSNHRPPNAFILFRSNLIRSQHVFQTVEASHRKVVPAASGLVKRKARDIEPRDNKRCAKIAESLIQGKKGDELDAAILEYDKHHVPIIVTRFEEPLTAEEYRSSSSPARSVSNASDDESFSTHLPVTSPNVPHPPSPTSYLSPRSPAGQSLSPITFDDSYTPNPSPPSSSPLSHPIPWDPLSFSPGPPPISAPPTFPSSSYSQHDNLAMPTPRRNLSIDTAFLAASSWWSFHHASPPPMSVSCQTLAGSPLNGGPYDLVHDYSDQYIPNINPFDIPSRSHQFRSHCHELDPVRMPPTHNDLLFDGHPSSESLADVGGTSYIHG